jgi:hypothetical protein
MKTWHRLVGAIADLSQTRIGRIAQSVLAMVLP